MESEPETNPIFQRCDRTAAFPYSAKEYARRATWALVQHSLFRWSPGRLAGWRRMLLRLFGATIGDHSNVRPSVRIIHPWLLKMGDWSAIADGVHVYNLGPISIGDHSVISQRAYLCAGTHDYTLPNLPLLRPPITIGSGVWVATEAFIGPGVTIGNNAVIGARAVVTKDVACGVVAAGNPARTIKQRDMEAARQSTERAPETDGVERS